MTKSRPATHDPAEERIRERCRAGVVAALVAICRQIEQLQTSGPAQAACREVEGGLLGMTFKRAGRRRRQS